jgi:hypothetical protein
MSLTPNGNVRYDVNGFTIVAGAGMRRSDPAEDAVPRRQTHVIFEPLDFIARLAALVPKLRVNLTRLCGDLHRRVYAHIGTMRRKRIDHEESVDD